jgi:hypothetical protein
VRPAQTISKPGDAARLDFPVPLRPGPLAPHPAAIWEAKTYAERSHACGSGPVSRPRAVTTRRTERRPHGARGRGSGVSGRLGGWRAVRRYSGV